ncbi:serine/threonine-protein phosphatase with EF-hands 2 isoform X1 [Colossoma macropomum]|uniref:serine/threonine-protein phosphatase with EF-hands 2 isoform X1 n=1 Tax=Colossoma macropomum TaxID=42526 RepID=UPI0018645D51|nr:serine/threonine-protein phosphatase with EF-hands 2 isoform X1 [Colossoma macropomum]XP_036454232.1 serine/threonine-protein phosphatase with EF-hands 2 isoform X1 [Colossoma macropomum]
MGCGVTKGSEFHKRYDKDGNIISVRISAAITIRAAVLIQRWYRQYVARMEMRRRYTWNIFQSIEYAGQQDQIKLYNFLGYLVDNFTPSSTERNLISHIFRENEVCRDVEWERYFDYRNIEVPEIYSGPRLTFPLDAEQAADLVEAFRNKQQLHSRYVLQLLVETWKLLRVLPNINRISTCHSKEITICGDLHGQLEDLILIFYKNGMPSLEKPYVFNGDFVDRGKDSIEILLILFAFLLVYPGEVHLNRGNHEDHIINLRYGFTKEVLGKYKMHGKRILKLLQKIFSWLPLATVIDQKVLIVHGGISDTTDLALVARVDRHRYVSALRPPKKRFTYSVRSSVDSEIDEDMIGSKYSILNRRRASLTYFRPFPSRESFQRRSLQDFSATVARTMEEEMEVRRRQAALAYPGYSLSCRHLNTSISSESDSNSVDTFENINNEWKQILDLLWSDPMMPNGCIPNEVRGGGCYWGPNVTEEFLNKHNLQLIIRSHECKQDGYEFCHNRKVLTIFSASNYYEVGSNRGAFIRLGPDLVPYFIQYQANSMTREMSVRQSVRRTEHSALKVLREQLFAHKSDLLSAFQEYDKENTGLISLNDWGSAVGQVLHLDLPWRMLRSQLITTTTDDMLDYNNWFRNLAIKEPSCEHIEQTLLETLYRHRSTLETIFRIVDTDNSGVISFEDFCQTWKLLSVYLKMEISEEAINDLVVSTDTNKDGSIDIDEFMESFRLVDRNMLERGKSLFMRRSEDQDGPPEEQPQQTTGPEGGLLVPPQ